MYKQNYQIKDEHIDFQEVVDGLYYPFYFEWTRHKFMEDIVGLNLEEEAKKGNMYMLTEYILKFKSPLRKGDTVTVTCELVKGEKSSRFVFLQKILVADKVCAEANFSATCLQNGGRPCVPDIVKAHLEP